MTITKRIIISQIILTSLTILRLLFLIEENKLYILFWMLSYLPWIIHLIIFETIIRDGLKKLYRYIMIIILLINLLQIHLSPEYFGAANMIYISITIINALLIIVELLIYIKNPKINLSVLIQGISNEEKIIIQEKSIETLNENHDLFSIYSSNKYGIIIGVILLSNLLLIQTLKLTFSFHYILFIEFVELFILHILNTKRLKLIHASVKRIMLDNFSIFASFIVLLIYELIITPNEKVFSPPFLIIFVLILSPFIDSVYKNAKNLK